MAARADTPSGARRGLVALLLAPLLVLAAWGAVRHMELLAPSWVVWNERSLSCDLDLDGAMEQVRLTSRRLSVAAEDGRSDATPRAWRISDVLTANVTGDGTPELVMLAWRRGNYGTSRPLWDTGPDLRMTQHLYVMGWCDGALVPVWMSHELGASVATVEARDDGRLVLTTTDGQPSTWVWDQFGFVIEG